MKLSKNQKKRARRKEKENARHLPSEQKAKVSGQLSFEQFSNVFLQKFFTLLEIFKNDDGEHECPNIYRGERDQGCTIVDVVSLDPPNDANIIKSMYHGELSEAKAVFVRRDGRMPAPHHGWQLHRMNRVDVPMFHEIFQFIDNTRPDGYEIKDYVIVQYKKDDGTYVSNGGGWFTHKLTGTTFKH